MWIDVQHITLEDLNEDTRLIVEVVGMEVALKIVEELGGTRLHVQSPRVIWQRQARRRALVLYTGDNLIEVCRATGLSVRQLRRLLRTEETSS